MLPTIRDVATAVEDAKNSGRTLDTIDNTRSYYKSAVGISVYNKVLKLRNEREHLFSLWQAIGLQPEAVLDEPELAEYKTVGKQGEVVVASFGLAQSCKRALKAEETRAMAIDGILKAIADKKIINPSDIHEGLMEEARVAKIGEVSQVERATE